MTGVERVVAVADLLRDDVRVTDHGDVASRAAQQIARLARCAQGVVVIEGVSAVRAAYPGAVGSPAGEAIESVSVAGGSTVRLAAHGPISGCFDPLDEWLLSVLAERVAAQLEILELRDRDARARAAAKDLQIAADIQRKLMAADRIDLADLRAQGATRPAQRLGGDVVALVKADEGILAVLGDVSGKGVAASVLTSALLATVSAHVREIGLHPGAVLRAVAESMELMLERAEQIVTLAIVAVEAGTGAVRSASAGHHLLHIVRPGGVDTFKPTAPPLGVRVPDGQEREDVLLPGDFLVAASDGLSEQRDPQGRLVGDAGYVEQLATLDAGAPAEMLEGVYAHVSAHAAGVAQDDDQSIVIIHRVAGGGERP